MAARSIELLYFDGVGHEVAMTRLAVSRASFYRFRNRGLEALAAEILRPVPDRSGEQR